MGQSEGEAVVRELASSSSPRVKRGHSSSEERALEKKRRVTIKSACNCCRRRKIGCDGKRPTCFECGRRGDECVYTTKNKDETPAMALKRQKESLQKRVDEMADIHHVLEYLNQAPEQNAIELLKYMRSTSHISDVVHYMRGGLACSSSPLSEFSVARSISYPTILPMSIPSMDFDSASSTSPDEVAHPHPHMRFRSITPEGPSRHRKYCDDRLSQLKISFWTNVPVSNEFAATVISLLLETDQAIYGFFDAELFVNDLVEQQTNFCSRLLVDAVMFWACQAYTLFNPVSSIMSHAFYDEAKCLREAETTMDTLLNVAALLFLSLGCYCNGNTEQGAAYTDEAGDMARRMQLIGAQGNPAIVAIYEEMSAEWCRAASHVAWGMFNWLTISAIAHRIEAVDLAPCFPIPGDSQSTNPRLFYPLPKYMGQTFTTLSKFFRIMQPVTSVYYHTNNTPIAQRVPFSFAESRYQELLTWMNGLSLSMKRGEHNPAHVLQFHIWFHAAIIDLFRPFSGLCPPPRLVTFVSIDSSPEDIMASSIHQLQVLAKTHVTTQPSSRYSIPWHLALLYVANATIANPQHPNRRTEFFFCIQAYTDLYAAFRMMEVVVRGLLSMAMRSRMISSTEAKNLMQKLRAKGRHHQATEQVKGRFMIDLEMATTAPDLAQVDMLASMFDFMIMAEDCIGDQDDYGAWFDTGGLSVSANLSQ